MNEVPPRCAVPGSSCRLLQLEAPGARPVWAVLDAAGTRRFTGEITMHGRPNVRVWFNSGELYYAERDGDAPVAERLLAMGVVTERDLAAGSVQLGAVAHLGRLFDRVPELDRDRVELALEILTGEVVGEIADHVADDVTIASYRHHSSGVARWQRQPTVVIRQAGPVEQETANAEAATRSTSPASVVAAPSRNVFADANALQTREDAEIVAAFEAGLAASVGTAPTVASEPVIQAELVSNAPAEVTQPTTLVEPVSAAAVMAEPVMAEPVVAEPVVAAPVLTAPLTVPPVVAEPVVAEPVVAEPVMAASATPTVAPSIAEPGAGFASTPSAPLAETAAPETPVFGGFELDFGDLRAELEAEVRAQLGSDPEPVAAESTSAVEESAWQIDDRVGWQVEEPIAASSGALHDTASSIAEPVGGEQVVEVDIDQILRQMDHHAASGSSSSPTATDEVEVSAALDADDDIRAAVRAALVEIEAATRSGGNDEIPSILMQAALADSEPGLAAPVDNWVQASLGQAAAPEPDAPIATLSLQSRLPDTPIMLPGGLADSADHASSPVERTSQESPASGGLRRTIGIPKPT